MSPARYWWKLVGVPLVIVGAVYLLTAAVAHQVANGSLYYPNYGSRRTPARLQKIRTPDGTEIAVLYLPNPTARFTLWFFHGNAEDLGDIEPLLQMLHDAGYAVFAFDYPGYGHSGGRPSESSLYAAARAAGVFLRDELKVPAESTLIYGRSLGGGPATQMALEQPPAGLVLQSTFLSVFRIVTRWRLLPFDQFENVNKIGRIKSPVLVMHGLNDEVIPFRHGETLFNVVRGPRQSLWVPDAGHNDLVSVAGPRFLTALEKFSVLCARASGSSP